MREIILVTEHKSHMVRSQYTLLDTARVYVHMFDLRILNIVATVW